MTYDVTSHEVLTFFSILLNAMKYYQRNIIPEPDITDSKESSLRIRFSFPVPADQGKAPERILRRFRTANSFQVRRMIL